MKISAIILAAGSSSRMGQSKQLLKIGKETLLENTISAVLGHSDIVDITVVLGANHEIHNEAINCHPVNIVINSAWEKGMGSSLKAGLKHVLEYEHPDAIVVLVCDQPLLTNTHIGALIATHKASQSPVVASFYSAAPGVPALFHRSVFDELLDLPDDQGAKKIIQHHQETAMLVNFPGGDVDLDTPGDYDAFMRSNIR